MYCNPTYKLVQIEEYRLLFLDNSAILSTLSMIFKAMKERSKAVAAFQRAFGWCESVERAVLNTFRSCFPEVRIVR